MLTARQWTGLAAIGYTIAFNIPFSILASTFDYPDVLRRPAGEVLTLFAVGGAPLVLTWYAFVLVAVLLLPMAIALAMRPAWVVQHPALSLGAAIAGGLSALAQAIGLSRWVFVIPEVARNYADPAATDASRQMAETAFSTLNLYGGVAIGEHIGQLFLALFLLLVGVLQARTGYWLRAVIGLMAAAAIFVGTGEGLAIALGSPGEVFGMITIAGFLLLTAWLLVTGASDLRPQEATRRS